MSIPIEYSVIPDGMMDKKCGRVGLLSRKHGHGDSTDPAADEATGGRDIPGGRLA